MLRAKRYILLSLQLLLLAMPLGAQTSTFALGVRGGGVMWLPETVCAGENATSRIGGEGIVEFRYTYYGHVGRTCGIGITAGLDAGYSTAGFSGTQNILLIWDFPPFYFFSDVVDYGQTERYMRTDASLMFALHAGGFVLNVGPRFMMPFFGTENTSAKSEKKAGFIAPNLNETSSANLPLCNLLMGIEAGWEFPLSAGALGLQAYADIGVWNNQKLTHPVWYESWDAMVVTTRVSLVDPAESTICSANGIVQKRRLVDFGIRLYYAFYAKSSPRRARPCPPWDTRLHHNRLGRQ